MNARTAEGAPTAPDKHVEPRNPLLLKLAGGTALAAIVGGLGGGFWYLSGHSPFREKPFHPDQCGEGSPTPGKGGISAVNHAFEDMDPPVVASNQTITNLGREANNIYGGTMDISDSVQVCVDLEKAEAKVYKPSSDSE